MKHAMAQLQDETLYSRSTAGPPGISIILPVYNNSPMLPALTSRLRAAICDRDIEIIMVNDGSVDNSLEVMRGLDVVVVDHPSRRGQNQALLTGLKLATQPTICVMDADLQDPPEAVPTMLNALVSGEANVVFSSRTAPRRITSRIFRFCMRTIFRSLPSDPCLCFVMDSDAREALVTAAMPGDYLVAVIGALKLKTASVPVVRNQRPEGRSGYAGLRRMRHGARMLASAAALALRPPRIDRNS